MQTNSCHPSSIHMPLNFSYQCQPKRRPLILYKHLCEFSAKPMGGEVCIKMEVQHMLLVHCIQVSGILYKFLDYIK